MIVTTLLKNKLPYQEAQEKIGQLISYAMLKNKKLSVLHEQSVYKFYSFNNLYPTEKTGIYQKGKIYIFQIRMVKLEFAHGLKSCLAGLETETFKVIATELKKMREHFINFMYTLTPCIVTIDGGPFEPDGDLDFLKKRLEINAEKKYHVLYGQSIESDFIERIEVLNHKPTVTRYKHMNYLGNKLKIYVRSDQSSQQLARLVSCAGLGEKSSSLGAGFCFIH